MKVRMAWSYPERTRVVVGEDGRDHVERVPDHPKRLARESDWNWWVEDVPLPILDGYVIYEQEGRGVRFDGDNWK